MSLKSTCQHNIARIRIFRTNLITASASNLKPIEGAEDGAVSNGAVRVAIRG
jgi:hypothetical protein